MWCSDLVKIYLSSEEESDFEESLTDMVVLTSLLTKKRKHAYWEARHIKARNKRGEFRLFTELSDENFRLYYRMTREQFEFLHEMIKENIERKDTNFRKAIGTRQRLAIALR